MGRRIMAERRRKRRKRLDDFRRIARHDREPSQIDAQATMRFARFVRVLARQAARELFESELRATAEIVQ